MDAKTLNALTQSIEKWERNAVAIYPREYTTRARDCALCDLFAGYECRGCPVSKLTEEDCCRETPYATASKAKYAWLDAPGDTALRDAAHAAARAEVEFLRSLLPEGEDR